MILPPNPVSWAEREPDPAGSVRCPACRVAFVSPVLIELARAMARRGPVMVKPLCNECERQRAERMGFTAESLADFVNATVGPSHK